MVDIFPIDFTTDVGRLRKYIPDLVQSPDPADPDGPASFMWSDAQLQSFIDDEYLVSDPTIRTPKFALYRAAAYVLIATANNENLILKKIVTEDLETDGPAVAKAMIAAAQEYLKRADKAEDAALEADTFIIVGYEEGAYMHPEGTEWPLTHSIRPVYY